MRLLNQPKTDYTDFYDIARFSLAWKINLFLTFALLLIALFFSFYNPTTFVQYLAGFIISLTGMIYLIVTKEFKIVSYFISFACLALVISSLFFVKNAPHLIEPIWMIIITIFGYFTLGKKIGHTILGIVTVSLSVYFYFFLNDNYTLRMPYTQMELIGLVLEFIVCMFVIGYFLYHFIQVTAHAEEKFRFANKELNDQNSMIQMQHEEKTVLLQEIHHRVKNNLQVITSLLRLQSHEIKMADAKVHFNDAINRIMTMSLIHQKMYQEENLSMIDASDYFTTLMHDLIRSSSVDRPIQIKVDSQLDRAGSKTIVPLALLVSELVTNSLKHAFHEKEGSIHMTLSEENNGFFVLKYRDNGKWKDQPDKSSFGLQLIQTLTEQLEGEYVRNSNEQGTVYQFRLSNLDQN